MAKTKPNEKCPCDSGYKYKRCCQRLKFEQQRQSADQFQLLLQNNASKEITDTELSALNTYFLDRYKIPCMDITDIATAGTLNKIHSEYRGKRQVLLMKRTEATNGAFNSKGAGQEDDVLVIWKNNFLTFNYEKELNDARKAMDKWGM